MTFGQLNAELEISAITSSGLFNHLNAKTQVAVPRPNLPTIVRTRLSHSHEVANSAAIIALNIDLLNNWEPFTTDYKGSVRPCSLLHDTGHSPLSHPGAWLMDSFFRSRGVPEGFCDNNNNLTVIEKSGLVISDHTIASVIKYPNNLYPYHKDKYGAILSKAISEDHNHFSYLGIDFNTQEVNRSALDTTVACQIMDAADRNTYITSDLADFICLEKPIPLDEIVALAEMPEFDVLARFKHELTGVLNKPHKKAARDYFNQLRIKFNRNFNLTPQGLSAIDHELNAYREFLWEVEERFYINPIREEPFHLENMASFEEFILKVVDDGFVSSETYAEKIRNSTSELERLRAQRDMIAETTDWYVTQYLKTNRLGWCNYPV